METVGVYVVETQTGFQRRQPEEQIDRQVLADTIKAFHAVADVDFAEAPTRDPGIAF